MSGSDLIGLWPNTQMSGWRVAARSSLSQASAASGTSPLPTASERPLLVQRNEMGVAEIKGIRGVFRSRRAAPSQMGDADLGPMAEPGHILRLLSIVVACHWIPQVVGSQVLVDGPPDWLGRAAIPRAEHKRSGADGLRSEEHTSELQ